MKFIARLLGWNDVEANDLRERARHSTACLEEAAKDLSRTVVLKAQEIEEAIKRIAE